MERRNLGRAFVVSAFVVGCAGVLLTDYDPRAGIIYNLAAGEIETKPTNKRTCPFGSDILFYRGVPKSTGLVEPFPVSPGMPAWAKDKIVFPTECRESIQTRWVMIGAVALFGLGVFAMWTAPKRSV